MTEYTNISGRNQNNLPSVQDAMNSINTSLQMTNQLIMQMNGEMSDVKQANSELANRVGVLENNVPITRRQADNIKKKVRTLARELVGYPSYIYGVTCEDIYRYLRDYFNLANAVGDTEKQYYNSVIQGIETYKDTKFDQEALTQHKRDIDAAKVG